MQHRRFTRGVLTLAVIILIAGCSGAAPQPTVDDTAADSDDTAVNDDTDLPGPSWNVTVTRVVDGDTVDVRYENGSTETVRLLGVDTPETPPNSVSPGEFEEIPDSDAGREHLVMWGGHATEFAERTLAGKEVRLVVDDRADRRGGYGRLLGYLYVDGENFNQQLLANGYARLYDSTFTLRDEFAATEATARDNGVGLWSFENTTATETTTPAATAAATASATAATTRTPNGESPLAKG